MEGIWDSLLDSGEDSCSTASEPPDAQLFLALSKVAIGSAVAGRAICFNGSMQSHTVSVLIDSGSFASFIGDSLAAKLVDVLASPVSSSVRVAGGGILQSTHQLLFQVSWTIDQFTFVANFQVLPLTLYDLIVGMDWLEQFSPTQIHWHQKWMIIPYQGQWVFLQGINSVRPDTPPDLPSF